MDETQSTIKDVGNNTAAPTITAVVCTRNTGERVVDALQSILQNTHPHFELLVIDQSSDNRTQEAVARLAGDPRLRYVRSDTVGSGRARNLALALARTPLVAYTDDDCVVPDNWLAVYERIFNDHPRVLAAFTSVLPAEHDRDAGFIPAYIPDGQKSVRTLREQALDRSIGASMAVRRQAALAIGGFDPMLGPGGEFQSAEDRDLPVRAIIKGWEVFESPEAPVIHAGFRTWEEGKQLTRRDWIGLGAAWAKPLKCGHWGILAVIAYDVLVAGFLEPLSGVLKRKRPRGFKRLLYFACGFYEGWKTPVDCQTICYREQLDV